MVVLENFRRILMKKKANDRLLLILLDSWIPVILIGIGFFFRSYFWICASNVKWLVVEIEGACLDKV